MEPVKAERSAKRGAWNGAGESRAERGAYWRDSGNFTI
jgi:hypothetical protein